MAFSSRSTSALGRRDPVYYPRDGLPFRFVGLSSRVSYQTFDEDFNALALWSWYRVENVQSNAVPFEPADSEWFGPGSLWPNVWHYGLGVELIPFRRVGTEGGGLELALRLEYVRHRQTLALDFSEVALEELRFLFTTLGDVPASERVHRNDFTVGLVLTF